jgi:hypothetical protein
LQQIIRTRRVVNVMGKALRCALPRGLVLPIVVIALSMRPVYAGTIYNGFLPFTNNGPEDRFVTTPSTPEDEQGYTVGSFLGPKNTVRLIQKLNGEWGIRILTYSEVNNVAFTGGNLQEVSGFHRQAK